MKDSKRAVVALSIFATGSLALAGSMYANWKHEEFKNENLYPLSTVVFRTNLATDTVTVEDFNGNLWQFTGVEDWMEGDICACIMDSKGTRLIKDDEIVSVQYCGWVY